ncbi:MAG: MFS transporter [Victivallaceae bacterium]
MEAAEKLTLEQRSGAKRDSIKSACYGALSSVMIQDSAIIILFATILGAGDMLSMITTSTQGIASCLLLVPAAFLSGKLGYKKTIMQFTAIGAVMIMLLAACPWFHGYAKAVLLLSIIMFSVCMTVYAAAWFPLLDGFLVKSDRSDFFGVMRFSWQTFAVIFCFVCGLIIGKNPEIWMLQVIIAVSGLGLLGRMYYIGRIPDGHQEKENISFTEGISEAIANKSLAGFSVYICCLYLAAYSTPPLTFIYIKKSLLVADNIIIIISSIALVGTLLGFLTAGKIIDKIGIKRMLLCIHFFFAFVNLTLFFIGTYSVFNLILITALLATYGFAAACSSIAISTEMMELASPNNKAMSMAFCGSCFSAGTGGSRLLASLILGSGMLAPEWFIGTMKISHYQTLFLVYGCAILFVCLLLVLVPAIFPKGNYRYMPSS